MVEFSFTFITATISTIVVVTMATLFFCCWRKKGSGDIVASKNDKNGSTKEGVKADRSGSITPSVIGRSENGVLTESQSATDGETKLPLLNVTAFTNSSDDLGDFSAVERETEILRSYRKPPPPKHRARQTRVPRLLKNGNESSDIFTELSEEDARNEVNSDKEKIASYDNVDISDKEKITSYDNVDISVWRPQSEDKLKSPRDTRSSMLADIEQALAALHVSDQSETVHTVDSALPEDKTGTAESVSEVDNRGEKTVSDPTSEPYAGDFIESENIISSTSQALISAEDKTEPSPVNVASSPKQTHTVKPKTGPMVSPKPSPKSSSRVSSYKDSTSVDIHRNIHDSKSITGNSTADERSSNAAIIVHYPTPKEESVTTDIGVTEETGSCLQTPLNTTDEAIINTEAGKPLDSTASDILTAHADTVTTSSEGIISKIVLNESDSDKLETVKMSDMTESSETTLNDTISDEDAIADIDKGDRTKSANEMGEADFASQELSENVTIVSDNKQINPSGDATKISETPSTAQKVKTISDEVTEQNTQQPVTETASALVGQGESDVDSKEEDKLKESSEDQTGKGKISKIPVRSEKN